MRLWAGLAQLVERQFCKLDVAGSIPATGTIATRTAKAFPYTVEMPNRGP